MSGARVSFEAIERRFEGTGKVIDGVSFTATPGEFVSLLGPSGCGKSTFLRLAAGLDSANQGKIEIDDTGRKDFRGFVFQDAHLLPWRTVLENVALPLELIGHKKSHAEDEARAALSRVGLSDASEKFPAQLSGGMKMRASVARALVTKPSLLLMDEPFSALDENTRHQLQEDLVELWAKEKMTVLFVTHSVAEAVFVATRAVVFSPRPAKVILEMSIDLPTIRSASLRTSPEFAAKVQQIYGAIGAGAIT